MELTVLGCSGSYGAPRSGAPGDGACSGYLVRDGDTAVMVDCGHGTFANLQRHMDPTELSAVIVSHEHADHCVDIYGLHVMLQYGSERRGLPVFAPAGAADRLGCLANFADTFAWHALDDGGGEAQIGTLRLRFARTDHPIPTFAVEATGADGHRLVYTSDTGPGWSVDRFAHGADVVLSEASYVHAHRRTPIHLSGRQAGEAARRAEADRLVLTHVWPQVDPEVVRAEGSEAFGAEATLAAVGLRVTV